MAMKKIIFLLMAACISLCSCRALDFDGSNDYVVTQAVSFGALNQLTLEAWILPVFDNDPILSGYGNDIIHKRGTSNVGNFNIHWYEGPGANRVTFRIQDQECTSPDGVVSEGQWMHVAGVYDGSEMRLYLDGRLSASVPYSSGIADVSSVICFGGKSWDGLGRYRFNGIIDDARIWNIARTRREIRSTMNSELCGDEPGLIGYWNFIEETGDIAYDLSSQGNDGTLVGPPDRVINNSLTPCPN